MTGPPPPSQAWVNSTGAPLSLTKSTSSYGVNDILKSSVKKRMDESIAKHLEKCK